jgi:nitrite reductase/ring-hydroxylating ferredoxin subunit
MSNSLNPSDAFVRISAASEIREHGRARVNVKGRNLAIFDHEGAFHAVDNRCAWAWSSARPTEKMAGEAG